jgi:integrase
MSRRKGVAGPRKPVPPAWQWAIEDYLHNLAAEGQREATRTLRGTQLRTMARALQCPPEDVTAAMLVNWFGQQTWSPEHRRSNRSAARGFFAWAYKQGRVPAYLGDFLPGVPQPKAAPRPAPDDAWAAACAAADARTMLMLRLAAEAGLRRSEVAQVNTRDVFISRGAAQLMVHGKGGKQRLVPISDDLAEAIRQGAAGHTPGMPSHGWLFADGFGGHLAPQWVGMVVAKVLPEGYSMHTLRHRFASRAYRGTRNLRAVQTLLGHASIATTERYTAVDDDEIRAAMMSAL